jgi:mannose-6-phosphate isomerase
MALYRLKNTIQHYPWGSPGMIPDLMGIQNPEGSPWAELWIGAHPKSPSLVETESGFVPLNQFIVEDPVRRLGKPAAERFGGLPFLFKILAARTPLSIQAHPAMDAARRGFERENAAGIPMDAFERNYKDDNHKPELLLSLGDFSALLGFRTMEEIQNLAEVLGIPEYRRLITDARGDLKGFFLALMNYPGPEDLIADIVSAAKELNAKEFSWVRKLAASYPGDIGVAAPLYMNILDLREGEAIYLDAGKIHAYLGGLGLELMANSDNVLRGGLTSKHIDLAELSTVLDFSAENPTLFPSVSGADNSILYRPPVDEFVLSRFDLTDGLSLNCDSSGSCAILLCTSGRIRVEGEFDLVPGDSLFVSADQKNCSLEGAGTVFRAGVP